MDRKYGITNQNKILNDFDKRIEEFKTLGYTVIEDVLTDADLEVLRNELDRVYKLQEMEFTREGLRDINEEFMARALLCYSEVYMKLSSIQELMKYVQSILGDYYILHLQNGIINMPNQPHHQNSWHRDLPYQNWISSEPMGCNLFYCLDPFTPETGSTIVLPYSHKMKTIPSDEYIEKHSVQLTATAGSVVLFDSMVLHKAGYNSSTIIRRGVNNMYVKPILRQQIDLPRMLDGKYSDDPFLNMLFGYDAQTASDVITFRTRRLNKKKK